ncbi:PrpF domain-containing protein [Saccharopolyspora hirsuta]|uniref:PrpF domain-containing protein n=1 Tax=Saccharopolyspora hirsuta TaxID=1837 RepID=UPI00331680A9
MHVPATLVRGGTSKCWLFDQSALPTTVDTTAQDLEGLLVNAYGAADPVQLDGVGGATPTTSKAAVVRASDAPGIDVDYLFGQVGIGVRRVEWGSNCGNCATAIALWAVARGLVPVTGDRTRVVLRNTNTGAVLEAEVDTTGGRVHEFGTRTVPGTRAGGVAVGLTFLDPAGRTTGSVTPTGRALDELAFDGQPAAATMVDAGAPMVLLDAAGIGLSAVESLAEMRDLVAPLREVRHAASLRMGLSRPGDAPDDAVPKVGIVGAPAAYRTSLGDEVAAEDYDVSVRMLSMNAPHPAIGLTSAVGVAVAALLDGSVVRAATGPVLRIGTPAGVVAVTCRDVVGSRPRRVTVERAARILCEADLLVPDPLPA